jgi:outer membrane protein OmpA-like peptidoglycan-associated protein
MKLLTRYCSRGIAVTALLAFPLSTTPAADSGAAQAQEVPAIYKSTRDQAGHEFVKTEQFIVPVGTTVRIAGLEFPAGSARLTPHQELVIQQIFNSLEEVTENTPGDPDKARVAAFKKMQFEIRGYGDGSADAAREQKLGAARAESIRNTLTILGTPPWRLKISARLGAPAAASGESKAPRSCVEFVRVK